MKARFAAALTALVLLVAACGDSGDSTPTPTATVAPPEATATTPAEPTAPPVVAPNIAPAANITLPPGFTAYSVADGFFQPTSVSIAEDGTTYVSERNGGVYQLRDADGDGVFDGRSQFTSGYNEVTGLLAAGDIVYVSSRGRITLVVDDNNDGFADRSTDIATLPFGRHQNNGLVLGPDGKLYLTNGSTCDDAYDCPGGAEPDPLSATILQANTNGSELRVYATGLRNPYDIAFDADGRLWATENGSDAPCGSIDELNLVVDGANYGWPYGDACDPYNDGVAPAASLGLHTASTGIDSYDAAHFPPEYNGNLFLTLWGSLVYDPELPPQLVRAITDGDSATVETFGTGFLNPIDVAVDHNGTMLVADFGSGILYRIIYTG